MKLGSMSVNVSTSTGGKKEFVNPGNVSESSSLQKELLISMNLDLLLCSTVCICFFVAVEFSFVGLIEELHNPSLAPFVILILTDYWFHSRFDTYTKTSMFLTSVTHTNYHHAILNVPLKLSSLSFTTLFFKS
jgi:hypothetical protein